MPVLGTGGLAPACPSANAGKRAALDNQASRSNESRISAAAKPKQRQMRSARIRSNASTFGTYPLRLEMDDRNKLVDQIRAVRPSVMMSQSPVCPQRHRHVYMTLVALECRMTVQAWGRNLGEKVRGSPPTESVRAASDAMELSFVDGSGFARGFLSAPGLLSCSGRPFGPWPGSVRLPAPSKADGQNAERRLDGPEGNAAPVRGGIVDLRVPGRGVRSW